MRFLILRVLTHSELGMFHEYRRQGKERSKQRAINFDWDVVDRVFPAAKDSDRIEMELKYETDSGVATRRHWLKRQEKNWRLEGNCPQDKRYAFVAPGCLFAMEIEAGTTPATGAWAVFAENDEVTKAILSHGESSRLAGSAMIALHDDEGRRTRGILAKARPDLFSRKQNATAPEAAGVSSPKTGTRKSLPPNAARLVDMLASVGHKLKSAIADLVDNSISADATEIRIKFGPPNAGHGRWLTIADNGRGMDQATLDQAMTLGSASDYDLNALGKFGFGLKGASWSQTKVFTVVTRTAKGPARHLTWDVEDMAHWMAKSDPLQPWEKEETALDGHGTVVLWKDMRPPQITQSHDVAPWSYEVMELERHLALVFHRFLEGKAAGRRKVRIWINKVPVEPNNPVGHPLAEGYDLKRIRMPVGAHEAWVRVQAFLLPSEEEIAEHHKAKGDTAVRQALDLIGLHGKRNETQGLFIYRHDRLIQWGGWHGIWDTNDEKTKLARVVVNVDRDLDEMLQIDISKQQVQLPLYLTDAIKPLAEAARADSRKKYRKQPSEKLTAAGTTAAPTGNGAGRGHPVALPLDLPLGVRDEPRAKDTPTAAAATFPKIAVRNVKTQKFLWKFTTGMTGGRDLQVSDHDPNLAELVRHIGANPDALGHFSAFLEALDKVGVQKQLLGRKSD